MNMDQIKCLEKLFPTDIISLHSSHENIAVRIKFKNYTRRWLAVLGRRSIYSLSFYINCCKRQVFLCQSWFNSAVNQFDQNFKIFVFMSNSYKLSKPYNLVHKRELVLDTRVKPLSLSIFMKITFLPNFKTS